MKKSSKAILIALSVITLSMVIGSLLARAQLHYMLSHHTTIVMGDSEQQVSVIDSNPTIKRFKVGSFSALDVDIPATITVQQGSQPEVIISGPATALAAVGVDNDGGKLSIEGEESFFSVPMYNIKITVITNQPLRHIETNGAAKINYAAINSDELKVEANGAAQCYFAGTVRKLKIEINGSARVDAKDLVADEVKLESAGASQVYVTAKNSLQIEATGTAHIRYYGNPKTVMRDVAGIVRIDQM